MNILIYDIDYNQHTGYYNIVDNEGNRCGEYLTYGDAEDAMYSSNTFDMDEVYAIIEDKYEEYVVCREYLSHRQMYVMFTRGQLSDHVSYPESSVAYRSGFNDTSIKIYNSKKEAEDVAERFNEMSRDRGLYKYANWKALMKWW